MSSQSMSRLGRSVKHGIARLTASADSASSPTRLTQVSHKAPMRLLPMGKSSVQAGAAICALSTRRGMARDFGYRSGAGAVRH
jgi:hypothetical protein